MSEAVVPEGWTWLANTPKWHYFREGRSLCGKWGAFGRHDFSQEANESPDNCAECKRRRLKEIAKEPQP